jgi:hypothetical protein
MVCMACVSGAVKVVASAGCVCVCVCVCVWRWMRRTGERTELAGRYSRTTAR